MTDAFIQAADGKGHCLSRFDAAMSNISSCCACETCFSTGKAYSQGDIKKADGYKQVTAPADKI